MSTLVRTTVYFLYVLAIAVVFVSQSISAQSAEPYIATIEISGAIDKTESRLLNKGVQKAYDSGAEAIILLINTPGGDLDSTRKMVRTIYESPIPVITFVWPSGSQAASAGTFLLAAGHIAAMAPSTNVGAAKPVSMTGEDLPPTVADKATEDAASFLRSIALTRNRNVNGYEETVTKARAYSSIEALENGIINFVSKNVQQLVKDIDGSEININDELMILDISELSIQSIEPDFTDKFLQFLANPNIALILLAIGVIGILIELINPGGFIAGITGVAALALALVALGNLPVNWTGLVLIGLSVALFYIEVQVSGIGIAGVIGGVMFVIGAVLLFGGFSQPDLDGPSFMANTWILVGISAVIGIIILLLIKASIEARSNLYKTVEKVSVGQLAKTITELNPTGTIYMSGEEWSAVSDTGVKILPNSQVIITNKDKLILKVKPFELNE